MGAPISLPFPEKRPFRFCQVTDLQDKLPMIEEEMSFLRKVLLKEKPDLAILTGDNSDTFGDKEAFPQVARNITELFQEAGVRFAVTSPWRR